MDDPNNLHSKDHSQTGSLSETKAPDDPHVKNKKSTKKTSEEHSDKSAQLSVKKMMVYRQIGAKIAYYRTLRQMTQANLPNAPISVKAVLGVLSAANTIKAFPFLPYPCGLSLAEPLDKEKFIAACGDATSV